MGFFFALMLCALAVFFIVSFRINGRPEVDVGGGFLVPPGWCLSFLVSRFNRGSLGIRIPRPFFFSHSGGGPLSFVVLSFSRFECSVADALKRQSVSSTVRMVWNPELVPSLGGVF